MKEEHLLENEKIITQSGNYVVTLTNKRVRYDDTSAGRSHLVSILLDKVSSIEVHYKSILLLLVLGVIMIIGGVLAGMDKKGDVMTAGVMLGGLLLAIYFFTRKHVVSISSDGGANIHFKTKGMNRESILKFINQIEEAKVKFE